jgi:pSer/pThr/pTyr-binding forkhead associated (FHA) protein
VSVFCNQCGHRNPAGSYFCSVCGAALSVGPVDAPADHTVTFQAVDAPGEVAADESLSVTIEDLPEGLGLVVVKRGPNAGSKFVLEKDVTTAGRHPEADLFLDDITVSRLHAEFRKRGDDYVVVDVGSLNGTYVNRERTDEATLAHGDEVQIGVFKLVFFSGDGGES